MICRCLCSGCWYCLHSFAWFVGFGQLNWSHVCSVIWLGSLNDYWRTHSLALVTLQEKRQKGKGEVWKIVIQNKNISCHVTLSNAWKQKSEEGNLLLGFHWHSTAAAALWKPPIFTVCQSILISMSLCSLLFHSNCNYLLFCNSIRKLLVRLELWFAWPHGMGVSMRKEKRTEDRFPSEERHTEGLLNNINFRRSEKRPRKFLPK